TPPTIVDCQRPSPNVVDQISEVNIALEPNPVAVRQIVDITVDGSSFGDEASIGVDASWQCWDGSEWATTHIIYRGFGDKPGETIAVNPDFQIQVPDIALWLDHGYSISIPQVEPGTYRIEDDILVAGESVSGFVFVEVIKS
ncbi:MAG TPA: hypothetical protein VMM14_08570, partial [Acidimicrobiia bacterium]|nr:hypothetical protein [Acidimicrobiia bacterium]